MTKRRTRVNIQNKVQNTPENAQAKNAIKIPQQLYRITTDMSKYRHAVQSAENLYTPQRYLLYQLYQQTMLDPHVTACIAQLKDMVMGSKFIVCSKDGKEVEDKTQVICRKWFKDFISHSLDSIFWGHSLIQFEDVIKFNGIEEFKEAELVPRIYVCPEFHRVMSSTVFSKGDGIDYLDLPYRNWCISVGDKRDLGLLLKLTPLVIWKKNAMGAWAEFIEKFGSPIRIGKTDAADEKSVNNMEGMLRNMGTASWGIFRTDDIIELVESKHSDAFEVFDKMIERCNSEIAKLILGQTGTTDEKAFVGGAEVHERILASVGQRVKQFIYSVNNDQLVPMMNNLGFGFEGLYIDIEKVDEWSLEQKGKFDVELMKTGKFKFTKEYLKEKYDTEVIEVEEPEDTESVEKYKNVLSKYYT